jgi:1-deoxy-D-xylulose-5-phosphate synthase
MSEKYLSQVNSPADIKGFTLVELNQLARELRGYILTVVSQKGGHLASNLGAVELSVALEYVFDTARDRLVWDVGHQSYSHKILTGRREAFQTLRQFGGLSGFPKREESPTDPYDTGHSSTSIAAAVGFAKARDLDGLSHKVVAVIGDGALTGGQAFEALNLAGDLDTDILVVLNDNHMSIAPNIGGLSQYLSRMRSSAIYTAGKQAVRRFLGRIPWLGKGAIRLLEGMKDNLRYILVNGVVFQELGFRYYGPVDGHNLKSLIEILEQVKEIKGPVLLHVVTEKGRGYKPATENAAVFHGVGPFDLTTGKPAGQAAPPTYTAVFSQTLLRLAAGNPRILAITAAMADGTGLEEFHRRFPERFFDVGIAEQTAVTLGAALALAGFRPVVAIYSTFLQRAYDQLIQDAALQNAPVIFALDRAGLVGEDGPTHHGMFDLSYLSAIPNMAVLAPRDEGMLAAMLELTLGYRGGPAAIRYPRGKGLGGRALPPDGDLAWGRSRLLRPGGQALIIAAGPLVYEGLAAAAALAAEGIDAAVLDIRFVKPLDREGILTAAAGCRLVLTAEENAAAGGVGQAVSQLLMEAGFAGRIRCLALPDQFITQGGQEELRAGLGLNQAGMVKAIRAGLAAAGATAAESTAASGGAEAGERGEAAAESTAVSGAAEAGALAGRRL